ncbi:hypothetical protein AB0G15_27365 [Streptosporangium sp. NPDC023825]|uniref:hypothetical protein n=1 Tax=Streptosporangium sp. NPDC023825 TaxID=3154909 RepID=UPI0034280283
MREPDSSYVRRKACRATETPWLCISDDVILTHHTFDMGHFFNEPRYETEREVSLLTGQLSVEAASRYRRKIVNARDLELAAVRCTTAGKLRSGGFAVVHTPGRILAECDAAGQHVSVIWPAEDPLNVQKIPWPPTVTKSFVECFNGYIEDGR